MLKHARLALATILVASASTAAFAQGNGPKAIPNSQKYKNSGVKPATGRSGSAQLEARALLAKNGTMQIEASTGTVESGTGPGTITKAQIKINGVAQNFNGLSAGGYWTGTFVGTNHKTPVQVQTNIKGIDPKRTDVVTVTTPAVFRPDVAVMSVAGPDSQKPLLPVEFAATVRELNGDLGARANCVFSVDGTQKGIAEGIWVDANGTVSCLFSHTFEQPGTYTVSVAATGVVPGDWDAANNAASATITIVEPSKAIKQGYMEAYVRRYLDEYRDEYNADYCYDYYSTCHYRYERVYRDTYSYVYMNGWMPGGSSPLARVDAQVYGNGSIVHQSSLAPIHAYSYDYGDYYYSCRQYYEDFWNGSHYQYSADRFGMCTWGYRSSPGSEQTDFWYQQLEGDAVYYGGDTYCGPWGCNVYTWQDHSYRYGSGADLGWGPGTQVRLKLAFVEESGTTHTVDRSVTLQGYAGSDFTDSYGWFDGYWHRTYYRRYLDQWANGSISWNE